ncbi:hypothetical protein GIB67_028010 [Kingdonia uniflora]|uniref:Protein kinase domain-containing protein n=1 Tax=Kingdonia uniflora TaxID=39325 RepID=A0A7J7L7B8_9MAGN|nr:hypothetical protein GIB67_028010 [Kingdonia uniflora]
MKLSKLNKVLKDQVNTLKCELQEKTESTSHEIEVLENEKLGLHDNIVFLEKEVNDAKEKMKSTLDELRSAKLDVVLSQQKLEKFCHGAKNIDKMLCMGKTDSYKRGLGYEEHLPKAKTPQITKFVKTTTSTLLPKHNMISTTHNHAKRGHKQWVAEVQFLGVVEHPNLVKLIGYCGVDGERGIQRLLVYEFMPNKSLDGHLFIKAFPALPWLTRLQILLDAAQGLIIYRNFKSSNVLLDEEFKAKLSDFGLAREGPADGETHISTAVMGTYGYAAPGYIETGHLSSGSDVWSFGVALYEILIDRRVLDRNRSQTKENLLQWVKQFPPESRRFNVMIDP